MKEHKLISMVEFVLEQIPISTMTDAAQMKLCRHYANFLSQPLTLGMFVPCDENGEVLIHPDEYRNKLLPEEEKEGGHIYGSWEDYSNQYQQAKERVLFEGFEYINDNGDILIKNGINYYVYFDSDEKEISISKGGDNTHFVEGLNRIIYNLTLTQNAIKTIYG